MFKKRNLLFLSLLILGLLLLSSCFLNPPATEGILKGQVIVPEGTLKTKDLSGQALPDATVNIIDLSTGSIIATTVTDATGYYQVAVPPGGPYLLEAVKGSVKLEQITCSVEVGIEYDLGTADCSTTAVALIVQAMLDAEDYPNNPADINLTDIEADPDFSDVMSIVCSVIEAGEDPALSAVVQQAVEDFLYPPAPVPPPPPPPIYTVTYDGNGSTGGDVPVDANLYEEGTTVTVLANTGTLSKTDYTFAGWNTQADGNGTNRAVGSTFILGAANETLYAKWTSQTTYSLRDVGPAGGLIFYINPNYVTDGWRYLEAAPTDQSEGAEWGCCGTIISGADGTAVGTGKQNTIDILNECATSGIAADICADLSLSGYDDWFLPSKDELNLMYENLEVFGGGGFADDYYWSSSEYDAYSARGQGFHDGGQHYISKDSSPRVRAVRAFRSTAPTYIVNYNGNESTSGTVPSDSYHYEPAENVMVLHNTGTLVKTGYTFDGWNTAADGNGTDQAEGSNFTMGASDVTLYAKWLQNFTITFDKNDAGATGTMADQTIASGSSANLMACGFTKIGWTFAGWATTPGGDVEYTDEASYTMGIADVTLYAKWTPLATYSLRDIGPAGGYIFYDKGSSSDGWRYLEAAPVSTEWYNKEWGSFGTLIGGTETGIGTGQSNTTTIVTWLDNNTDDTYGDVTSKTDRAAYLCDALTEGGYDDWFLPSKDELNLMYENLKVFVIGGFADYSYWSSSEYYAYYAWYQYFGDGSQYYSSKEGSSRRVRAVRAF